MKKFKNITLLMLLTITLAISLPSCMTTKTQVGSYKETKGTSYKYSKGKQFWLFWGFLPVGRTNVNTPASGNCEVVTKFTLLDAVISGVTGGIVISYTIKVKAKRQAKIDGDSDKSQEYKYMACNKLFLAYNAKIKMKKFRSYRL